MAPKRDQARRIRAAAHELRNQLQALLALADEAGAHVRGRAGQSWSRQLGAVTRALETIVDDWLPRGRYRGVFDPRALAREAAESQAPCARRRALSIRCRIDRACPGAVRGDPRDFRTLIGNLLGNAIKFTHRGEVAIRLSGTRIGVITRLRLEVEDTGPGLPESGVDLFTKLAKASRARGGSGLGLRLAREAARRLGGELTAADTPRGGAQFVAELTLPTGCAAMRPSSHKSRRSLRVLLVEDHPLNRALARRQLVERGHRVRCAGNGRVALRLAKQGDFDLALVDLGLPDMGGAELAARLRAIQPSLRILAWSGETDPVSRPGFDGFLRKPCSAKTIIRATEAEEGHALACRILLRHRRKECARLDEAQRSGSAERIAREAHRTRGALAMAGLSALAALAGRAEQAAAAGRTATAGRELGKISAGLRRLGDRLG